MEWPKSISCYSLEELKICRFGRRELAMESLTHLDFELQDSFDDDLVKQALSQGLDLREYNREIEQKVNNAEQDSISDYLAESSNIASLHKQIKSCDSVLVRMEEMLEGFQVHLGNISSEIQSLQQQSQDMNIKLKNRQSIRGELSQYIHELLVTQDMISHIIDTPVTEREFLEQLQELNGKINFIKEQKFRETRAAYDVEQTVYKLKYRAVAKIREFCLLKLNQFKKPMANYHVIQNALLKFKFYFEFMACQEPSVAREIKDEYIDTMGKVYLSYFKAYSSKLIKLQVEKVATKDDVLGEDDSSRKSFFSSRPSAKQKSSTFTLGGRGLVLNDQLEAPAIVPHAASKDERKYTYEQLFRSLQFTLLDTACREFIFVSEFFMLSGNAALETFNTILSKTMSLIAKEVELQVKEMFDSLALFICIQITRRYQIMAAERRVPALDRYYDVILSYLQPRLEFVFAQHTHSVQIFDAEKHSHIDQAPHYISRRYAEFGAAMLALNEHLENEQAIRMLSQLELEMQGWLLKMAAEFANRRDQLVFLINNYDLIINIVAEHTRSDSQHMDTFKSLLAARTDEFVEEVLSPHFGGLMAFVREAEHRLELGSAAEYSQHEQKVSQLVRSFNGEWKRALELINSLIMRSFTNLMSGVQILQASLTQLIQFYHRLQKVMSQNPFKGWPIKNELISIHNIMMEVKKHKINL